MRIYLADLAHTHSVSDASLPVPLSIGYLKAYAVAAHGSAVDISLFKHPERLLARVAEAPPAVIGLSNYGWNVNLNLAVGRYLRQSLPGALIVAGGPNIDPEPERQLAFLKRHDYLDYLIVDGGEEPFSELLHWYREGSGDRDRLPSNVVWGEAGRLRQTSLRPLSKAIENIPSPYLDGYLDEFLEAGMVPMLETNRGCPFRCTFCAWGMASKDLVRRFDLDTALAEVRYIGARSKASNWLVCDANFGILKRDVEIAKEIRAVHDRNGLPRKCHVWLAKNVTERNLEIGKILGDMTVPVMAVQSLDDEVLTKIKRGNISTETYIEYQKKFHAIGSKTYSDLIVPLPGETLDSHIEAIRRLADFGVDIIQNHNMRLLAGAETNSTETRETYGFRTRYRLIHGDAGAYRLPDGGLLRCFEYEESLRETNSMREEDLFYLRKLHFLVDFCWNIDVYKPLLKALQLYGTNPIDVLRALLEPDRGENDGLNSFWEQFDRMSRQEWFDSEDEILAYFAKLENFDRLLNQEFEKLNVMFSVMALRDYKPDFDRAMLEIARSVSRIPESVLRPIAAYSFAAFPPLCQEDGQSGIEIPENLMDLNETTAAHFEPSATHRRLELTEQAGRRRLREILAAPRKQTLSKVLNTQGISLSELRLVVRQDFGFDGQFRRAS